MDSWLLFGGRIRAGRHHSDAIGVEGGTIIALGTLPQVSRAVPQGTNRIDLRGRLVIPGLIDAHLHLGWAARLRDSLDLRAARSLRQVQDRTLRWAETHPRGPILGRDWNEELFEDRRAPLRSDLDRWSGERPAVLLRAGHHSAVVNSAALQQAGYSRQSPDPVGGRLGRDERGEPNGQLFDRALERLRPLLEAGPIPEPSLQAELRSMASQGLTTVGSMSARPVEVQAVRRLAQRRQLPVAVRFFLARNELASLGRLQKASDAASAPVVGIKTYADGSFGSRTAELLEPYSDGPGSGLAVASDEELIDFLGRCSEDQLQPAIHAVGDRAVVRVVRALRRVPVEGARIEHVALTPPEVLADLDRVRPHLVVQPGFLESDWWLSRRLGRYRCRHAYAFRTLLRRGHHLAGSSDAPVDPVDPWRGLRLAIERAEAGRSASLSPHERLSETEALALYTSGAADALGAPHLGRLSVGSTADFVVLNRSSLPEAIRFGVRSVDETWRAGRRVYRRKPLSAGRSRRGRARTRASSRSP